MSFLEFWKRFGVKGTWKVEIWDFLGYGHLVPITPTGRVFCIGFALVGIPLLLVTIADIGQFLSEFLNYLHQAIRSFEQKVGSF